MMQELFNITDDQTTIITPNFRVNRYVYSQYSTYQYNKMVNSWTKIDCVAIDDWWQRLWNQHLLCGINNYATINKSQELILWQQIIKKSNITCYDNPINQLAQTAQNAWEFCKKSQINYDSKQFNLNENHSIFANWARQFANLCNEHQLLDSSSLIKFLTDNLCHHKLNRKLIVVNLPHLTKQEQEFFRTCLHLGMQVVEFCLSVNTTSVEKINYQDQDHEIRSVVNWAHDIRCHDTTSSICYAINNLAEKKDTIARILQKLPDYHSSYKIYAPETLIQNNMIQHAIYLLGLPVDKLSIQDISIILHSPFIGNSTTELAQRVQLDYKLRQQIYPHWLPNEFNSILEENNCYFLANYLKEYYKVRLMQPKKQTLSKWAGIFNKLLNILRWPDKINLTNTERIILHYWEQFEWCTVKLSNIVRDISYAEALECLKIFAQATNWNNKDDSIIIPQLEIIDLTETTGSIFNYLWVSTIDTSIKLAKSNPFIPYNLTANLDNTASHSNVTHNLQNTTEHLIFSGDPTQNKSNHVSTDNIPAQIFFSRKIEPITDQAQVTPFKQYKLTPYILTMQSLCPFKAFAKLHLHAKTVPIASSGLSKKTQEAILQHALNLLWNQIENHTQLVQLNSQELATHLKNYLQNAIDEIAPFLRHRTIYNQLILQKLCTILLHYLELDKQRPFFQVVQHNAVDTLQLGNYMITCNTHRIDELADKTRIIINYTMRAEYTTSDWFSARPKSLSLPTYMLRNPHQFQGLAWAKLNSKKCQLLGISHHQTDIPGIHKFPPKAPTQLNSWQAQLDQWHDIVHSLAQDISNGVATVTPQTPSVCRSCNLQSVCRVHSKLLNQATKL